MSRFDCKGESEVVNVSFKIKCKSKADSAAIKINRAFHYFQAVESKEASFILRLCY